MWGGPLTTCAVWSKGWNELHSSALKELKIQYKRWVGKHITPYGIRTELWQVCIGAMGMQRRGAWPYPGLGLSELRLKDQLQPAEEEAEEGDFQTELEHPWLQKSWPGSESSIASLSGPGASWVWVTWASFYQVCLSWWSNHRTLGIWSHQIKPSPSPFPPTHGRIPRNLEFKCSFLIKLSPFLSVLVPSNLRMVNAFS